MPAPTGAAGMMVSELIVESGREWDRGKIMAMFNEQDAGRILDIPFEFLQNT